MSLYSQLFFSVPFCFLLLSLKSGFVCFSGPQGGWKRPLAQLLAPGTGDLISFLFSLHPHQEFPTILREGTLIGPGQTR